jgi:RNA polymerase sigma factor (TIGR02999 family)
MQGETRVTRLLRAYRRGDDDALAQLIELVYDDLRRLARRQRARVRGGGTLQTTALVHEAYLKLAGGSRLGWQDRAHFMAVAGCAIRQVLVDYARARRSAKRGGGAIRVELAEKDARFEQELDRLLLLDELLGRLAAESPRLPRVVECRYFAGMTEPETAAALSVSERTVRREWQRARRKLRGFLAAERPGPP